jgi:serine/threonine-protein kinase
MLVRKMLLGINDCLLPANRTISCGIFTTYVFIIPITLTQAMVPETPYDPPLRRLLTRLRDRKMVQWAIAYGAGAWLTLQVIDTVGPRWGLTESMSRTLDVALAVGFAATLVLAWYHGEQGRQRVSGMELLVLGALLLLGGIGLRLTTTKEGEQTASSATQPGPSPAVAGTAGDRLRTIAILPFDNYSPNEEDAYFAAGITEEITGQLARIGDLTVLSRVAVERAVQSGSSLEDIARVLGAGTILEGSVRMAGEQVRITAQLIEVGSQRHLWSENFARELTDIFQIQTDVALAIGDALLAKLSSHERQRIETPVTDNLRAYQLYLKQQRLKGNNPEDNRKAIELLEQVLKLDPEFAEARARLSWRHTWNFRNSGDPSEIDRAESLALDVTNQDPELSMGHYVLGAALEGLERSIEAGAAYARAYELNPNDGSVLSDGSFYFAIQGAPAEGLEMAFQAVRQDPNNPNERWHAFIPLFHLGDISRSAAWLQLARDEGMDFHRLTSANAELELAKGNLDAAASIAREMLGVYPENREARVMALQMLFLTGNTEEVRDELVALGREAPRAWALYHIAQRSLRVLSGFALAEQGDNAVANRAFDESLKAAEVAVANGSTLQGRALDAASIHAYRGDREAALRELERAYELGVRADFVLAIDPFFAPLRDEPRFQALLERMAESKREQQEIAGRTGALDGYDELISAGPAILEVP